MSTCLPFPSHRRAPLPVSVPGTGSLECRSGGGRFGRAAALGFQLAGLVPLCPARPVCMPPGGNSRRSAALGIWCGRRIPKWAKATAPNIKFWHFRFVRASGSNRLPARRVTCRLGSSIVKIASSKSFAHILRVNHSVEYRQSLAR
jgi:hypothetical protein